MISIKNILKRSLSFNLVLIFILGTMCCEIYAFGTDFNHYTVSAERKAEIIGYLDIKYIVPSRVVNDHILSFDVSQDGTMMAVAYSNDRVGVYDTNGKWLWGIEFVDHDGAVDCELDDIDNELLLFCARDAWVYKIDKELNVIDVAEFDSDQNGDKFPYLELTRPKIRASGVYKMSHSQVWVEENGKRKVLIDHSTEVLAQIIAFVIMGGIMAWLSIAVAKEKRNTDKVSS